VLPRIHERGLEPFAMRHKLFQIHQLIEWKRWQQEQSDGTTERTIVYRVVPIVLCLAIIAIGAGLMSR
jgi:hypothetical protein